MKKKVMSVVLAAAMVSAMVVPAVSASAAGDKLVSHAMTNWEYMVFTKLVTRLGLSMKVTQQRKLLKMLAESSFM